MNDAFLEAWLKTGREEGGHAKHPADSGGETMWGVTERLARAFGYMGPMAELPRDLARSIAKEAFWDVMRLDEVSRLSLPVAHELFDTGVNMGPAIATIFLQRCLNAFNLNGTKYPDIDVDGQCGDRTLAALDAYVDWRGDEGERVLLKALNCLQGERYIDLSEKRPANEAFCYGWMRSRVAI